MMHPAANVPAEFCVSSGQSLGDAYRSMIRAFQAVGIDTAALDARLLLSEILAIDATVLISNPGRPILDNAEAVTRAARRRIAREPVSRILGWREFYGRRFDISPATLDPRPDSETLIDCVLEVARSSAYLGKPLRILDVGTGSGCLIVTLLAELPNATGIATDISPEALQMAERNAVRHGVSARMSVRIADALDGFNEDFDILVSNPPYIATIEIPRLHPDVKCYDPILALDGGVDGLRLYRRIAAGIVNVVPKGYAFFEIGSEQSGDVVELFKSVGRSVGWAAPTIINDLGGNARCVAQKTLR